MIKNIKNDQRKSFEILHSQNFKLNKLIKKTVLSFSVMFALCNHISTGQLGRANKDESIIRLKLRRLDILLYILDTGKNQTKILSKPNCHFVDR